MARQNFKGKSILVLGIETAPARSAALQLCREGAKVTIGSRDYDRLDDLAESLDNKHIEVLRAEFPEDTNDWEEILIKVRDFTGHIHMVVNAQALAYKDGQKQTAQDEANYFNEVVAECLKDRGPLKIITLWEKSSGLPEDLDADVWHSTLLVGPYQRLDSEDVRELDSGGISHLRAGAIADSVVSTLSFPPGALPKTIDLNYILSSEKKK